MHEKIKQMLLKSIIAVDRNENAYDDDLQETYEDMEETLIILQNEIDKFLKID